MRSTFDAPKTALKRARVVNPFSLFSHSSTGESQVKNGLPRDVALRLAAQTVFGSAKMTLQGDKLLSMRKAKKTHNIFFG